MTGPTPWVLKVLDEEPDILDTPRTWVTREQALRLQVTPIAVREKGGGFRVTWWMLKSEDGTGDFETPMTLYRETVPLGRDGRIGEPVIEDERVLDADPADKLRIQWTSW